MLDRAYLEIGHLQSHLDEGVRTQFAFLYCSLSKCCVDVDKQIQVCYLLLGKCHGRVYACHTVWRQFPLKTGWAGQGLVDLVITQVMAIRTVPDFILHVTCILHEVAHYGGISPRVLGIHTNLHMRSKVKKVRGEVLIIPFHFRR